MESQGLKVKKRWSCSLRQCWVGLARSQTVRQQLDEAVRVREAAVKASVKDRYDTRHHTAPRHLAEGDAVFVQQASGATERATVLEANAHEATVETEGGAVQRRHLDQVKPCRATPASADTEVPMPVQEATDVTTRRSDRAKKQPDRLNL